MRHLEDGYFRRSSHFSSTSKPIRFEALDTLRGLAACLVVIFHMPSDGYSWTPAIVQNGYLAVTFFFILSGFVINASYGERLAKGFSLAKFMFLRWGRIYPLHAAILAIMVTYELARHFAGIESVRYGPPFTGTFSLEQLGLSVGLLQDVSPSHGWNRPSWSIGVEFWAYLVYAIFVNILFLRIPFLVAIAMISPGAWLVFVGNNIDLQINSEVSSLIMCCMGFGIGVAIYDLRRIGWHLPQNFSATIATASEALIIFGCIIAMSIYGGRYSLMIYPLFSLAIIIFSAQAGYISKFLTMPIFLSLGTLSYSIYLVHQPVQDWLLLLLHKKIIPLPLTATLEGRIALSGDSWLCDAFVLCMLVIVIGCAALTYRFIEEPARKWSRTVSSRFGHENSGN